MKNRRILLLLVISLLVLTNVGAGYGTSTHFATILTGGQEVPPVDTGAKGIALLEVDEEESVLHFTVAVANIDNVVAAHIHLAASGVNGPVVVTLCGAPGPAPACKNLFGKFFIVRGKVNTINNGDPLSPLIHQMKAGNAYVNVHTTSSPSGEVRGQIVVK